jgi:hypothetical protein
MQIDPHFSTDYSLVYVSMGRHCGFNGWRLDNIIIIDPTQVDLVLQAILSHGVVVTLQLKLRTAFIIINIHYTSFSL